MNLHAVTYETRRYLAEVERNVDLLVEGDSIRPLVSEWAIGGWYHLITSEQKREEVRLQRRISDIERHKQEVLSISDLRELSDLF